MRKGNGFTEYAGYTRCLVLENKNARIILGPQCGGRILAYSWKSKDAIILKPKQNGWLYAPGKPKIDPYGGRFDIGPEMTILDHPKLGIDSYAGWFAYLMRNGLFFIKKFPVYPDRVYNEMAAITISIYYTPALCELEPIGPRETIEPGASASYTEDWWLADYPFPSGLPNLKILEGFVRKTTEQ